MQVVTANRLADGVVVFLTVDASWSERITESAVAAGKEDAAALLALGEAAERERQVVAPYLIEVACAEGRVTGAKRFRERIRAAGPTVRTDLGKQAAMRI